LGHIHCGHLGSGEDHWWPDRRGLNRTGVEFEAESVSYIVCRRLGLETTSAQYLAGYVKENVELPLFQFARCVEGGRLHPRNRRPHIYQVARNQSSKRWT
jgi:hypothetical protein